MDPILFTKVCTLLWGRNWRPQAAVNLRVNERTLRRWTASQNPIPEGVPVDLGRICKDRSTTLHNLAIQLEPPCPQSPQKQDPFK